jgi:multidrug efflux pump subunit AcrB
MMWIVILALRRPYTFVCMSLLIFIFGIFAIVRMPVDIFPVINLPVVTVVWYFYGMAPEEMERRIVTSSERFYSSTANDIEHIESSSFAGVAVIKIYFQPDADVAAGVAQITAASEAIIKALPPGATPPTIVRFNATDVPIAQLALGSTSMSEDQVNDYGNNFVRVPLATIRGAAIGPSVGGKPRQVMVDLDLPALYSKGLSPSDVSNAINAGNVILPAGTVKMGGREYNVRTNASPDSVRDLNDLPIKEINGATVYVRDVAHVREGSGVQVNIVRLNGRRGIVIPIFKTGNASTLDVIAAVKHMLPALQSMLPAGMHVELLADQSIFVRGAITGVITEAVIAACLTALMILLFLGSWRSTLIVATSIPLAVLSSIICLSALGQTLNQMTLGGLALAVGILVDDATVEIENINRNVHQGKEILQAIVDAASQIATPTFVASLSISIVFIPIFLLSGPAASLFRPLAMAVVFAVLSSYLLSRTIVPTMARYLLASEAHELALVRARLGHILHGGDEAALPDARTSRFRQVHLAFDAAFERARMSYLDILAWCVGHRRSVLIGAGVFCVASMLLTPLIGEDFFPRVDGGQFQLHVRAPTGTQVEDTELLFARVEDAIRREIPPSELGLVLSTVGLLNNSSTYLATGSSATIGPQDGDILVSLNEGHRPTQTYVRRLRGVLQKQFPGVTFFFQSADMVSQILNLGLPARVDVQVQGQNKLANYQLARTLARRINRVPGAVDVRVQQVMNYPELFFNIDRDRAAQIGLAQRDVANQLTISLSSSGQTAPNFWLDPRNGVSYTVAVQTPQYRLSNVEDLVNTPVAVAGHQTQLFGNLATMRRQDAMGVVSHYNVAPVMDVYASNDQRDLGGVASDIDRIVASEQSALPRGSQFVVRGQVASMRSSFLGLGVGILGAIVLAYLLMVVNFQSWVDPLVIVLGLPGALAGMIWMLYVTGTTFNVPSLMGAVMSVGVATSNSILLIVFAEDQRRAGRTAAQAALDAGFTRLRPVCMTALAMIIGMLPMSLGLGDGGEANAPLGRAVIGGLGLATIFTLFVVPVLYTWMRQGPAPSEIAVPAVSE